MTSIAVARKEYARFLLRYRAAANPATLANFFRPSAIFCRPFSAFSATPPGNMTGNGNITGSAGFARKMSTTPGNLSGNAAADFCIQLIYMVYLIHGAEMIKVGQIILEHYEILEKLDAYLKETVDVTTGAFGILFLILISMVKNLPQKTADKLSDILIAKGLTKLSEFLGVKKMKIRAANFHVENLNINCSTVMIFIKSEDKKDAKK